MMLNQIKKLLLRKVKIKAFIIIVAAALFIISAAYFYSDSGNKGKTLESDIADCNIIAKELRFSCYRSVLEKHSSKTNLENFISSISNNRTFSFISKDNSYAIFGTNCHTFYHALGDLVATYSNSDKLEKLLNLGPYGCTAGYTMGLYKRMALKNNFSKDLLKKFYKICREGQDNQCAHEIGHLLHDKYTYSILKILDDLSLKNYGLKPVDQYKYTTFDNVDLNAPFEECEEVIADNENLLAQCYTGIGHNMFIFSEFSPDGYKGQFRDCDSVAEENRDSCYGFLIYRIGINTVAPKFLSGQFDEGKKICDEVEALAGQDNLKYHCYIGLGGGIGLFMDSEYQLDKINEDNLVETKNALFKYASLCHKAEEEFIDKCFAGLMGTRFKSFYTIFKIHLEEIEKLLPTLESDFKVVG